MNKPVIQKNDVILNSLIHFWVQKKIKANGRVIGDEIGKVQELQIMEARNWEFILNNKEGISLSKIWHKCICRLWQMNEEWWQWWGRRIEVRRPKILGQEMMAAWSSMVSTGSKMNVRICKCIWGNTFVFHFNTR